MAPEDLLTAVFGASGVAAVVGGAVKFVWDKIEARFKSIEDQLAECRAREETSQERRATLGTVIELLWQELKRIAPDADILNRADKLMENYKTIGQPKP